MMAPLISLLALSATSLALILMIVSLGERLGSKLVTYGKTGIYDRVVLWLHGQLDWPEFSWSQPRRKDRSSAADAIALAFGAALAFALFVVVTIALIASGEGLSRPFGHSLLAIIYIAVAIAFARASMIAAVKRWYGIR